MVDELFFHRVACGKYGKISVICVLLTVRQAITSKVSLPSLSVIVMSHSFKNVVIWISKIKLKLSWFIRMKYIPSYCTKRNSSMVSRITWNVFFVHWVVREKYILSLYFASRNSKTSPPAYVSIATWRDGPFPAILQVMWHLDQLWLAQHQRPLELQNSSRNWETAQIEVNFVIFGRLTSWFFGLIMFWNNW